MNEPDMELPTLEFSFDYGVCLWDKGGAVEPEDLPISDGLRRELEEANEEFPNYLNWSDPNQPPVWTIEQTYACFSTEWKSSIKNWKRSFAENIR